MEKSIPLVDEILAEWKTALGRDFEGYRNHVCRMLNFCLALGDFRGAERDKLIIAGCFHDLGIWTDKTLDYLPPSAARARDYLTAQGLESWIPEITTAIEMHHKLGRYAADEFVEIFRRADLVDFSLGLVKSGLPADFVKSVKKEFPNAGFHLRLARLAGGWVCRHPLNPLPILKW